jgi:DNA-binding NarL/FixJ family response regulator
MISVSAGALGMPRRPATARISVVIADADPFSRRTVRDALQSAEDIVVAADAAHTREALELAAYFQPDVLLAETSIPAGGGVELARELSRTVPEPRVALLATHYDEDEALRALRAGAMGSVPKQVDPSELRDVVRRLARGEAVMPPPLAARVLECLREVPDTGWRPVRSRLTSREWEVVDLMGAGESTQTMADRLVLSPATVYSHVKSVLRKLDVHCRPDAVSAAERLRREEASPLN